MCLMNIIMTVSENTHVRLCSKNKKYQKRRRKKIMRAEKLTTQLAVLINQFRQKNNVAAFEIADALEVHVNHVCRWLAVAECAGEKESASQTKQCQIDFDSSGHDDDDVFNDQSAQQMQSWGREARIRLVQTLHKFRLKNEFSQSQIAHALGLEPSNVSAWENRRAVPCRSTCKLIQNLLCGKLKIS